MDQNDGESAPGGASESRAPFNLAAFLVVFLFVMIVFDNVALALIFGAMIAGGTEMAQRAARKT